MSTVLLLSVSYWCTSKHEDQWAGCMITKGWDSHSAERQASQSRPSSSILLELYLKQMLLPFLWIGWSGGATAWKCSFNLIYFDFKARERLFCGIEDHLSVPMNCVFVLEHNSETFLFRKAARLTDLFFLMVVFEQVSKLTTLVLFYSQIKTAEVG